MTPAERFRLAASICLVGGVVDVAVLAGWAWPRALAELAERKRRAAVTTQPTLALPAPPPRPAPPPPSAATPAPARALSAQASNEASAAAANDESDDASDEASHAPSDEPSVAPSGPAAPGPSSVGVILFRTRTGTRWIDPDRSFRRIVDLAARDPNLVLAIDGYADHGGDRHDSKRLSLLRARKIAAALQSAGVAADRMIVRGHAGSRSRVRGHGRGTVRTSRRVEIRVQPRESP